MKCPTCGAVAAAPMRFCERDGTRLVTESALAFVETAVETNAADAHPPVACACGSTSFDEGFCTTCGKARPADSNSRAFDHVEQAPVPELAGVSDRGQRHAWNEDALALATEVVDGATVYVLVVCDGVSSAIDSQRMAQLASQTTRARLLEAARARADPNIALRESIQAAHQVLCATPEEDQAPDPTKTQPPGCTIVAAVVRSGQATIGWVGDSRAYRFGQSADALLTHDHSWFNEVVDAGEMTPEQAAQAPDRNAITRCLGPLGQDEPGQMPEVDVVACQVEAGQMLLLCSDGLWKYASDPAQLAPLVCSEPTGGLPLDISRRLVSFANEQGGVDNITAALLKLP